MFHLSLTPSRYGCTIILYILRSLCRPSSVKLCFVLNTRPVRTYQHLTEVFVYFYAHAIMTCSVCRTAANDCNTILILRRPLYILLYCRIEEDDVAVVTCAVVSPFWRIVNMSETGQFFIRTGRMINNIMKKNSDYEIRFGFNFELHEFSMLFQVGIRSDHGLPCPTRSFAYAHNK